jgi:hypothetical protein
LAEYGCEVQHAMGDADLLIVQSTIEWEIGLSIENPLL